MWRICLSLCSLDGGSVVGDGLLVSLSGKVSVALGFELCDR